MSKKLILVFVVIFFLFGFRFVFAGLIINEILYSPASKSWIEIYNNTDSDVDITQYKIKDAGVINGHNISPAVSGGSNIIPAHTYGIIAKDVSSVTATNLFHSALAIAPAGDTVILKNGDNVIDTVSISPNSAIDGNSLQLMEDGTWKACEPTPGFSALSTCGNNTPPSGGGGGSNGSNGGSGSSNGSGSSSSSASVTEPKTKVVVQNIKTQIIAKPLAYVGIPFLLEGKVFGHQGEPLFAGRYFWNFGDGSSRETQVTNNEKFFHTYFYPGDYAVLLEYYPNYFAETPEAAEKMAIKVVASEVSISSVGKADDFFIELSNNTNYDVDISKWFLISNYKSFEIPRNTILGAKKKIIISPKISHFSMEDKETLRLINSQKETAFDYSSPAGSVKILAKDSSPAKVLTTINALETTSIPNKQILAKDLSASASDSSVFEQNEKSSYSSVIIPIASLAFIGASAGTVYFIRRKKIIPKAGEDFKILDK